MPAMIPASLYGGPLDGAIIETWDGVAYVDVGGDRYLYARKKCHHGADIYAYRGTEKSLKLKPKKLG